MYSLYSSAGSHTPEFLVIFGYSRLFFRLITLYKLGLISFVGTLFLVISIPVYVSFKISVAIWQELSLVAKLFIPSVRCPLCSRAKDSHFKFLPTLWLQKKEPILNERVAH